MKTAVPAIRSHLTIAAEAMRHLSNLFVASKLGIVAISLSSLVCFLFGSLAHGACIRCLRVTVGTVLGLLAAGPTEREILEAYPYLEREDINQCRQAPRGYRSRSALRSLRFCRNQQAFEEFVVVIRSGRLVAKRYASSPRSASSQPP